MRVNWNVTLAESRSIGAIAARARQLHPDIDPLSLAMDLTATHNHICKLRFDDLLESDDFNFSHDVCGIIRNLDRDTLTLKNSFRPRFTQPE